MKRYSLAIGLGMLALLSPLPAAPSETAGKASLDGLWQGDIFYVRGQVELNLTVEIAASPTVGTVDIPILGLKFHPLQNIKSEGSTVAFDYDRSLATEGPDDVFHFRGELLPDGRRMTGEYSGRLGGQELRLPFELERAGEAGSPRPPEVKPPLTTISETGAELRAAFNRDQDKVRLVLFLSPTCGSCLGNAHVIQKYVMNSVKDDDLRVYVVWGPMEGTEKADNASEATIYLTDPRATHFWTGTNSLAAEFGKAIRLPAGELGWDTFQLFARGATWSEAVPAPAHFMYMEKSLPKELVFDGEKLREWVRNALQEVRSTHLPLHQPLE